MPHKIIIITGKSIGTTTSNEGLNPIIGNKAIS